MRNLFLCLAAMTLLCSCGGKMSSYAYNEKIVRMHANAWDYLNPRMEKIFEHEISKEEALLIVDSLNVKYDGYINELKSLNIPDGAEEWNNVCIELFEYVKDNVIPLYSESLNFKPESKEWYKVWKEVDKRIEKASKLEDKMMREQVKFAAKTNNKLR